MPRAQLLIEGFAPAELLALAKTTSLMPLFAGKPVCVTYGKATLMGGVKKTRSGLRVEVAVMQAGADRALPMLKALVQKIARLRGVRQVQWKVTESRVPA